MCFNKTLQRKPSSEILSSSVENMRKSPKVKTGLTVYNSNYHTPFPVTLFQTEPLRHKILRVLILENCSYCPSFILAVGYHGYSKSNCMPLYSVFLSRSVISQRTSSFLNKSIGTLPVLDINIH